MTVIGVLSVKHAPGATTAAVAIATASATDAVVVECDPAGGDIAARGHLAVEPGLVSLAAAGRHPTSHLDLLGHSQHLATGVPVVVAPTAPEQAAGAVAALASRLPDAIRSAGVPGVIDLGRWTPTTSANPALAGCDEALVAIEPTVAGVEHLRTRLDGIRAVCSLVSVLLIGERPYGRIRCRISARGPGRRRHRGRRQGRCASVLRTEGIGAPVRARALRSGRRTTSQRRPVHRWSRSMTATTHVDEEIVQRFRSAVAAELTSKASEHRIRGGRALDRDDQAALARQLINGQLEEYARDCLANGDPVLTPEQEEALARAVFDRLFQLGRLQPLLDDERIQNIIANGCDQVFVEYADGTKVPGPPIADSDDELIDTLREIGRRYGLSEREFNPGRPSLNLQLPDGSRLFAVAWVCDRPCRRDPPASVHEGHPRRPRRLGAIDHGLREFLAAAVRARKQIIVAGATGAGKTTMLRRWPPRSRPTNGSSPSRPNSSSDSTASPTCTPMSSRSKPETRTSKASARSRPPSSCA